MYAKQKNVVWYELFSHEFNLKAAFMGSSSRISFQFILWSVIFTFNWPNNTIFSSKYFKDIIIFCILVLVVHSHTAGKKILDHSHKVVWLQLFFILSTGHII